MLKIKTIFALFILVKLVLCAVEQHPESVNEDRDDDEVAIDEADGNERRHYPIRFVNVSECRLIYPHFPRCVYDNKCPKLPYHPEDSYQRYQQCNPTKKTCPPGFQCCFIWKYFRSNRPFRPNKSFRPNNLSIECCVPFNPVHPEYHDIRVHKPGNPNIPYY